MKPSLALGAVVGILASLSSPLVMYQFDVGFPAREVSCSGTDVAGYDCTFQPDIDNALRVSGCREPFGIQDFSTESTIEAFVVRG